MLQCGRSPDTLTSLYICVSQWLWVPAQVFGAMTAEHVLYVLQADTQEILVGKVSETEQNKKVYIRYYSVQRRERFFLGVISSVT